MKIRLLANTRTFYEASEYDIPAGKDRRQDDELLQLTATMSDGKKTSGNPMAIRFKPAVGDLSSSCQVVWVSRLRLS
jgi:hypothetical protein